MNLLLIRGLGLGAAAPLSVVALCGDKTGWPTLPESPAATVDYDEDGGVRAVTTAMNYVQKSVSKIWTRRDERGSDDKIHGVAWDAHDVCIKNGRGLGYTLSQNGFELKHRPVAGDLDLYDSADVVNRYYADCEALVRAATGARKVLAFDHNVRSRKPAKMKNGGTVQNPAPIVHGDYTAGSAPLRVAQLATQKLVNDVLEPSLTQDDVHAERFAIVNVWRPIEPVLECPLAFCDACSVESGDLVTFYIYYADRVGENYFAKHNPEHDWVYFRDMVPSECVLLKTWDSGVAIEAQRRKQGSTFALHSAFADPSSPPDAPLRESIEVRTVAIY